MIINSNYCQLDKVAQLSRAIRGHTKDHKFIKGLKSYDVKQILSPLTMIFFIYLSREIDQKVMSVPLMLKSIQ